MNEAKNQPIFQTIFQDQWDTLPQVLQRRYANRGLSKDVVTIVGKLDITSSRWVNALRPLLRLAGASLPQAGHQVPVKVSLFSQSGNSDVVFERCFNPLSRSERFNSYLEPVEGNEVIEFMRWGLGWRMQVIVDDEKSVHLQHRSYVWRIAGFCIPVPTHLILGRIEAVETAVSSDEYRLSLRIVHPWWGCVFGYAGVLRVLA